MYTSILFKERPSFTLLLSQYNSCTVLGPIIYTAQALTKNCLHLIQKNKILSDILKTGAHFVRSEKQLTCNTVFEQFVE